MYAVELILRCIRDGARDRAIDILNWFSDYFDDPKRSNLIVFRGGWVGKYLRFSPDLICNKSNFTHQGN